MLANMDAELIYREKHVTEEGHIIEVVIWRVPEPVRGSQHEFKYRAGLRGQRRAGHRLRQ